MSMPDVGGGEHNPPNSVQRTGYPALSPQTDLNDPVQAPKSGGRIRPDERGPLSRSLPKSVIEKVKGRELHRRVDLTREA